MIRLLNQIQQQIASINLEVQKTLNLFDDDTFSRKDPKFKAIISDYGSKLEKLVDDGKITELSIGSIASKLKIDSLLTTLTVKEQYIQTIIVKDIDDFESIDIIDTFSEVKEIKQLFIDFINEQISYNQLLYDQLNDYLEQL